MKILKGKILFNNFTSIILNFFIFIFSILGFILACVYATRDGYSHWSARLLYFTQQSNLWIAFTSLIFAVFLIINIYKNINFTIISIFKYIFTVSITITCIIFCVLLAPFADFNVWTFASILTHVIVPFLSILDFFTNKKIVKLQKNNIWLALIPPLIYFAITSILCVLMVDFGRGTPYPYFFMDFYSNVGFFGFIAEWPPQIGSFYWILILLALIYMLSLIYYLIHTRIKNKLY